MTPSIDDRIATMITAIQTIIRPALAEADSLAREQAGLLVGHLMMLRAQIDHVPAFERAALRQSIALAGDLVAEARGGSRLSAAAQDLSESIATGKTAVAPAEVRAACQAIDQAVEQLVHAARADGAPGCLAALSARILDHVEARTTIDRAWFAGAGFEADPGALPSIDDLMRRLDEASSAA
jgi:hypothetical protein